MTELKPISTGKRDRKFSSIFQTFEVLPYEAEDYDYEVYGTKYNLPKSGVSPQIESYGNGPVYKYDYGKEEIILIDIDGNEIYRKPCKLKMLIRNENRMIQILKDEAGVAFGMNSY